MRYIETILKDKLKYFGELFIHFNFQCYICSYIHAVNHEVAQHGMLHIIPAYSDITCLIYIEANKERFINAGTIFLGA